MQRSSRQAEANPCKHEWAATALLLAVVVTISSAETVSAGEKANTSKAEPFEHDPGWDAFHNRIQPKKIPVVTQDFGYRASNFAGEAKGEMGGRVQRATTPAFYAAKIPARTLNDKLSAAGTFSIASSSGSSGVFFGWFNAQQPGGGRPENSLGLDLDGEPRGARLAVRLISGANKSCGTFITPFIPGKYRPTPIRHNARYHWTLAYDPSANHGNGRFEFTIKSDREKPEPFEGKTFTVDVPENIRKENAIFDRFGLMNIGRSGNAMEIYFDDLEFDGRKEDFSREPDWEGSGNQRTYEEPNPAGAQNFGFSPETSFAGGRRGEIGGTFWRGEKNFGWYADRAGPFTLNDRLEASGKVFLQIGAPDSGMYIGWFKSAELEEPPGRNVLAVLVSGPTRIGHYFNPVCATADGTRRSPKAGPVIVPGRVYDWRMVYDPQANQNAGAIEVTLGTESVKLELRPGDKERGASFDHFGVFSSAPGGGLVKIYFDDLKYTVARAGD